MKRIGWSYLTTGVITSLTLACNEPTTPSAEMVVREAKSTTPSGIEQLPSGAGNGYANDVSTTGVIVGNALSGCDGFTTPVIWRQGVPSALPVPTGLCRGRGLRYSESTGSILGMLYPAGATSLVQAIPVIWEPSGDTYTVQELGLAPDGTRPYDVLNANELGHVVANISIRKAFWWSKETGWVRIPDAVGSTGCYAYDVNDFDQITGECEFVDAGGKRVPSAAFWSSPYSAPEVLPRVSGFNYVNAGKGLNNNGVVVGDAWDNRKTGMVITGVQWTRTGSSWTIDLIPGLGGPETHMTDINDDGWAIGSSQVSANKSHGMLWRKGGATRDLGSIGTDSYANGISPSGSVETVVVGQSVSGSGFAAVVWHPFR